MFITLGPCKKKKLKVYERTILLTGKKSSAGIAGEEKPCYFSKH